MELSVETYIGLIVGTWFVSQSLKYFLQVAMRRNFSLKELRFTYLYSSGLPSTHTAVLTTSFLYFYGLYGLHHAATLLSLMFSVLWIYEIYLQRKRYQVLIRLLDGSMPKKDFLLLHDLSGHDIIDIVVGVFVGVGMYMVWQNFL